MVQNALVELVNLTEEGSEEILFHSILKMPIRLSIDIKEFLEHSTYLSSNL